MTNMAKRVTRSLEIYLVLGLSFLLCVLSKNCPPGTYFDHGTSKCDPCTDICLNAVQQGTLHTCKTKCPGYGEPKSLICKNGTYYDKHVNKCEPCGPLCLKPEIQGTVHECNTKCPGFLKKEIAHDEEKKSTQHALHSSISLKTLTACLVVPVIVLVVIVLVCIGFLAYRHSVKNNDKQLPVNNKKKYPVQVEDRKSDSGSELKSLVIE